MENLIDSLYENWLSSMLVSFLENNPKTINNKKIEKLSQISQLIKLDKNILKPTFWEQSKFDYISSLVESYDEMLLGTSISVAIMTKNQEKNILKTIDNIIDYCDELVVVDTGSSDNTLKILKEINNPKIKIYEKEWFNDYSKMRNYLITLCNSDWIFFVDSDEVILHDFSSQHIREMLVLLNVLSQNNPIVGQIKLLIPGNNSGFSSVDRFVRNNGESNFFGCVHEEVRSYNKEILRIRTSIKLTNFGTLPSEMEKFNKTEKYNELTRIMMDLEPNNSRWVSQLTLPEAASPEEINKYVNELRCGLLKDVDKSITINNLIESRFTVILLEKYILILIGLEKYEEAIKVSNIALKKYSDNGYFLFVKYLSKIALEKNALSSIFEEMLLDVDCLNLKESFESSQQDTDLLQSLVAKYMFSLGYYEESYNMICSLKESISLATVSDENSLLSSYYKKTE